jgi:hypothetical protein
MEKIYSVKVNGNLVNEFVQLTAYFRSHYGEMVDFPSMGYNPREGITFVTDLMDNTTDPHKLRIKLTQTDNGMAILTIYVFSKEMEQDIESNLWYLPPEIEKKEVS